MGYGNVHHQTGSSVAVQGHHLIAGITLGKRFSTSRLTTTAFLEYGNGDYDSANRFASDKIKGCTNVGLRFAYPSYLGRCPKPRRGE
ncbi:MAG: hypothetical protein LBI68_01080 [Azoarcus sp.]|nr:hypothetical protein [Azoarcus sp.]